IPLTVIIIKFFFDSVANTRM
ncbi:hypothetical protein VCHENC02_1197B, partial [Vibrio harveyi]